MSEFASQFATVTGWLQESLTSLVRENVELLRENAKLKDQRDALERTLYDTSQQLNDMTRTLDPPEGVGVSNE